MAGHTWFTVEKAASPNVLNVRIDMSGSREEVWCLLRSDAHHDNPHCNQELEKKHLDEALEHDALILDNGDLFCAMQGKYDRRSSKSCLRPEHQTGDYLDALVRTAADFYEPYAHNWVSFGLGNHETSITDRHETSLTDRLVQSLRDRTGANCHVTGYTGWIRFMLNFSSTRRYTVTLWHMHGYGGGGPVTSDTIQAQRQRAYIDGADIMWSGHVHDMWAKQDMKTLITQEGRVVHRPVWYIKSPTYKDEYADGSGGWHIQTGKPPKPLGAWWLRLSMGKKTGDGPRVSIEVIPAT
jgi:hypothetical protein